MKKILLCLVALASTMLVSAQNKGDMYAGGTIGIGTSSAILGKTSDTSATFNFAPEYAYFPAKNFRIGASVAYNLLTGENFATTTHQLTIMPSLAYYAKVCENFYYVPTLDFGFICDFEEKVSVPGFNVALSLGSFEFRPKGKFGFSINLLTVSYGLLSYRENGEKLNLSSVDFRFGVTPSVGIKHYF